MVLLTSSTVSAILSIGIISLFTTLLFLVGYTLQQQSVNSLREAIRQPPPPLHSTTLPPQFRKNASDSIEEEEVDEGSYVQERINQILAQDQATVTGNVNQDAPKIRQRSLAYILALSQPSDLCSAALFAKSQIPSIGEENDGQDQPRLVLLYPSSWETGASTIHMSALAFMRDLHDSYPIIFHPVEFVKGWADASIISHLLGEMQRAPWDFERMLYLRTPGMVIDDARIESALTDSSKRQWTEMTAAVGTDPEMLMWQPRRGLQMPRGDLKTIVAEEEATTVQQNEVTEQESVQASEAAYLLFDYSVKDEAEAWSRLRRRFEADLDSVCQGKGLLPGEAERVDLRRRV
jgi:hypothetical protein